MATLVAPVAPLWFETSVVWFVPVKDIATAITGSGFPVIVTTTSFVPVAGAASSHTSVHAFVPFWSSRTKESATAL